jgi:hypothetical protein
MIEIFFEWIRPTIQCLLDPNLNVDSLFPKALKFHFMTSFHTVRFLNIHRVGQQTATRIPIVPNDAQITIPFFLITFVKGVGSVSFPISASQSPISCDVTGP